MSQSPTSRVKKYLPLILAALFLLYVIVFIPIRYPFEFDSDEGLNLIRSSLLDQGFRLYADIPSDQPPLFPLILANSISIVSNQVFAARLLVLGFSAILVFSIASFILKTWGAVHAFFGAVFVIFSPYFIKLSASVMIGLPSIALACLALLLLLQWHLSEKYGWLIGSGVVFALSLMIKLTTIILVPLMLVGISLEFLSLGPLKVRWQPLLNSLSAWLFPFLGALAIFGLFFIQIDNLDQLFLSHGAALTNSAYLDRAEVRNINYYLGPSLEILLMALVGAGLAVWRRNWATLFLFGWGAAAYAALSILTPVWYHHQTLVTIPASALAGIAFAESIKETRKVVAEGITPSIQFLGFPMLLLISTVVLWPWFRHLASNVNFNFPNFETNPSPSSREYEVLALMSDYSAEDPLVITDRPMFPARLGIPVPPELAVFSEKRLFAGEISQPGIIQIIEERHPTQVLLGRFQLDQLDSYLRQQYEPVYIDDVYRLYIRPDVGQPGY